MTRKEIFSKNLVRILENTEKSQSEVARELDVSQQRFNAWCTGVAIPRMDKIQALADYFHVPMAQLIETESEFNSDNDDVSKAMELYIQIEKLPQERKDALMNYLSFLQSQP